MASAAVTEPDCDVRTTPGAWGQLAIFIACLGILLSRRPDVLLHPQFFAEGGKVFFADAYNHGAASLLMSTPGAGYLQIVERLIALAACWAPLPVAPLATNLISLILMALPVIVVLSARCRFLGPLSFRLVLAFGYLALPSTGEVFANVASIKAYMPLLACLVVFCEPPKKAACKVFDISVLALFSMTGPTTVLFFPLVALLWWRQRHKWLAVEVMSLLPGTLAQAMVILTTIQRMRTHVTAPLGATPRLFFEILSRQMFLAPLFGVRTMPPKPTHGYLVFSLVVVLVGTGTMLYCLWKAPLQLKLFLIFSAAVAAASLLLPLCSLNTPQWEVMVRPGACNRYWLIPMLGFLASLVWIVKTQGLPQTLIALLVLCAMPVGIVRDWRHPGYPDQHFAQQARAFSGLPRGTHVTFAIEPPGWNMVLIKRR